MATPGTARAHIKQLLGTLEKGNFHDKSTRATEQTQVATAELQDDQDTAEGGPEIFTGVLINSSALYDETTRHKIIPPGSSAPAHLASSWLVHQLQEHDAQLAEPQSQLTQARESASAARIHTGSMADTRARPKLEQEQELQADKQYLADKVAVLQESYNKLEQGLQDRSSTLAQLEGTTQDAARKLSSSQDAARHLGAEVERLQRREAELVADLAQRDLVAEGLQNSLYRLSDKLVQLQALQGDAQRAEASRQLRSVREELEGRMQALHEECSAQLQHVQAELEERLEAACAERDEAQEAAAQAQAEAQHLRQRLCDAEDAAQRVRRCGELRAGELKRLLQAELARTAELQLALDRQEGACHLAQQENAGLRRDMRQMLQNREAVDALRAQLKVAMAFPIKRAPAANKAGYRPGKPR